MGVVDWKNDHWPAIGCQTQLGVVDGDSFHPRRISKNERVGHDGPRLAQTIHDLPLKLSLDCRSQECGYCLSALKRSYRDRLVISPEVQIVYLKGSREVISQSAAVAGIGHFATEQVAGQPTCHARSTGEHAIGGGHRTAPPAIV